MQIQLQKIVTGLSLGLSMAWASAVSAQSYTWKSVVVKGGGLVSGLIYSKAENNLLYARTDVGGAYRWDQSNKTWIPLTDGLTSNYDWGVWSIAPDPTNANNVYMAAGLYTASWAGVGAVYGSTNKGGTWTKLATLPFKLGGNEPGRGNGEKLQVDPNKSSILFLGSTKDGLYKSTNSGSSWTKVTSLSASYITFVEFDKSSATSGNATQAIYVGVADNIYNGGNVGVYKSTDGGSTWNKLTNHPSALAPKSFAPGNNALTPVPSKLVFSSGNTVYITFCNSVTPNGDYNLAAPHNTISNGAVYKYDKSNNTWTSITPSGALDLQGGFSSVAVHPTDPNKVIVATVERYYPQDELYFSADGGANWTTTFNSYSWASTWGSSLNKGSMDFSKAPYAASLNPHWTTTLVINPSDPNQVMFGTGNGVFASYNVSGLFTTATPNNTAKINWIFESDGIEESVPLEIISPPSGAPLVTAIGDFDGFVHNDLSVSPPAGRHKTSANLVGTTTSIAFAENLPTKMVKAHNNSSYKRGSYTVNGGTTWALFPAEPSGVTGGGQIAISADGNSIVWAPEGGQISYSTNNGNSWTACGGGVPTGLKPIADRANPDKFYIYDPVGQKFYTSTDAGKNFQGVNISLSSVASYEAWMTSAVAVFGKEGHLWFATKSGGLYRTTGGNNFTKISSVSEAYKVTVGKAAPNGSYPAIFIWGVVDGVNGLFRSDDEGAKWERINDSDHEYARAHRCMTGDPRIYGRLYLGTDGRGVVYGDKIPVTDINDIFMGKAITAYPNPFVNEINIDADASFNYQILNGSGIIVQEGLSDGKIHIDEHLQKGMYFLKLKQGALVKTIKVEKR